MDWSAANEAFGCVKECRVGAPKSYLSRGGCRGGGPFQGTTRHRALASQDRTVHWVTAAVGMDRGCV